MGKKAVIDLGTNTFHILVIEDHGNVSFEELYRERRFVNLAENGIETIGEKALLRAWQTLKDYSEILQKLGVSNYRVYGTAALRTASNGPALVCRVRDQLDLEIMVIDGDREAELIYKGTQLAIPNLEQGLIMDIGGGSTEFILVKDQSVKWHRSYPLGVTVLYNMIQPSDPMTQSEEKKLIQFLNDSLGSLKDQLSTYSHLTLIGASGSFEVLQSLLLKQSKTESIPRFELNDFEKIYEQLRNTSLAQRLDMPYLPPQRAKLIVVSFILMRYVLGLTHFTDICVSPYALKEGALTEL